MWHYEVQGKTVGPVPEPTILERIQSGMIRPETLVWKHGMANWCLAGDTELNSLFSVAATTAPAEVAVAPVPVNIFDPVPNAETSARTTRYRGVQSTRGLTSVVQVLLALYIAVIVISSISRYMELRVIERVQMVTYSSVDEMQSAMAASDARQSLIAVFVLGAFMVTAIASLRWIYVSAQNAQRVAAGRLSNSPGMSVGWYFVPVATLWKPYQAMVEIWKASKNPSGWSGERRTALLPIWWTLWIVSTYWGYLGARLMSEARDMDDARFASQINFTGNLLDIALCIVFFMLVSEISRFQNSPSMRH
jgi:uncharacterized membrane protein